MLNTTSSSFILKFSQANEQSNGYVKRVVGFVEGKNLLNIFDNLGLAANPRSAKAGNVTSEIIESIETSTEIFPFKTKGVLLGCTHYEPLQRKRYRLEIVNPNIEGILDGGHNMLAVGTHIVSQVGDFEAQAKKIKTWDALKEIWDEHRSEIERASTNLDFLLPIELLVPSNVNDESIVTQFNDALLDICAARNNNVQLTMETKAFKKGFYNELQRVLPKDISERIEWKTNDGGSIKVRDLIALSWVPLSELHQKDLLPIQHGVSEIDIYNNKRECSKQFENLMSHDDISKSNDGSYGRELTNPLIKSAMKITADLPRLYDKIYKNFPLAYNEATDGRFGRNSVVKIYDPMKYEQDKSGKYLRVQPKSKYTQENLKYRYPEALIMPLVYGLKALLKVEEGTIQWAVDPDEFLDNCLKDIASSYRLVLDMGGFDGQKIGKNPTSYQIGLNEFNGALLRRNASSLSK